MERKVLFQLLPTNLSKTYALGLKIYKCVMFLICFIRRRRVFRMEERWVIISVPV